MPLGKAVKETVGTLAEELTKTAKRGKRTEFIELNKVPEDIVKLAPEERTAKTDEFFEKDKSQDFMEVRQEDIALDESANFAQSQKQQAKIDAQTQRSEAYQKKVDDAPVILDAKTHANKQKQQAYLDTSNQKIEALHERKRDLYNKALNLKKEKEHTIGMTEAKAEGTSAYDYIFNILSSTVGRGRAYTNIEARTTAIYNRVNQNMYELKEALRTKSLGLSQNLDIADEVIRFLKDGKVKNQKLLTEVKQISEQWSKSADTIRNLRNQSGARIGKMEDWVIPQSHDGRKIKKAGFEAWKKNIVGKLDRNRIENEQGTTLENVLDSAFKNITAPKVESSGGRGGAVVAKRNEEARVLHFKTGDDIIDYNKEFAGSDVFATMDNHIRQNSNEIASMQILGSNPENTFNKLKELARADGMGDLAENDLDRIWRTSSGQADGDNIISNADATLANISGGHRALQVASKLGSATISSLADLGNMFLGSRYRKLNSIKIMGKGIETLLQEATTFGKVGKNLELANRIGVVSEFASASLANSRFAESTGSGFLQKSAETVIRASGLGSYTNSMRASFGLELSANIAENYGKKLDDVPFANMLKEYGIDEAEWDIIRKTAQKDIKGAKFHDADAIYKADEDLGYKVSEMITNEMNAFIVMPGDRVRRFTTGGHKKGTIKGEIARSALLFKSFPIAVTQMHLNRIANISTKAGKTAYAAKVIVVNTVMGGITLWAYDTVTGKTVRSVDRKAFVLESITKSGGLGIFGDFFIGAAETKYGHSFSDIIMGVPASTMNDVIKSAQDIGTKESDIAMGNIYKRAKSYIPGQNLWYTRAIIERTIGDILGEAIDPRHQKKKRNQQKAMRLRSQEFLFD